MSEASLICIDPGRATGWALFKDRTLVVTGVEKRHLLFVPVAGHFQIAFCSAERVLVELPQHVKVPVKDLITLSVHVGEIKRHYEAQGSAVELVWPTTWKGSVPKDIHNRRVLAALTLQEQAVVPLRPKAKTPDHNCVDAIGIGLWKLGRLR